jgi:hypothetical protein
MILALAAAVKNTSNATASWRDASLTFVSRIEKGMKKFIPFLWAFSCTINIVRFVAAAAAFVLVIVAASVPALT